MHQKRVFAAYLVEGKDFSAYPKFLLNQNISETAKMIYVLLLDRARLSMKKEGWQDEHGRVFIHYTIQSLAKAICKSEMTVKNALKALEQYGLIYRQRQGAGMPNRIFVKVQTENCPARGAENCLTGGTVFDRQTERKLSASKNKSKTIEKYYDSLKSGDDVKTVQENLGHATAAFTLDVYGHVTEKMKKDSADRMQAFIKSVS